MRLDLDAVRDGLGLTQVGMAALLSIHPIWLANIETGRRPPGPDLLVRLYEVACAKTAPVSAGGGHARG